MPNHPIWYLNLEANPDCELMVGAKKISARARFAEGEERGRLWEQMAEIYPPYNEYRERAVPRTIPVVVLDPAGEGLYTLPHHPLALLRRNGLLAGKGLEFKCTHADSFTASTVGNTFFSVDHAPLFRAIEVL